MALEALIVLVIVGAIAGWLAGQIVKGMGVYSEGPISNPNEVGPAIKRALDVVKKGEPALVDVVTQPR